MYASEICAFFRAHRRDYLDEFCSFIYYFGQELKLGVGAFIVALFEERASAFEPKFVGETQDFGSECFALHRESRQTLE
jgi:hypothetical protein